MQHADRVHFYLSSAYTFILNSEIALTPSFITRYVNGAPFSTDFTTTASFNKNFNFAISYRTDKTLAGLTQLTISNRMVVGLAYEYSLRSELINKARGTTELFLQFQL